MKFFPSDFIQKHHDKSTFIGNPELNWTLQQKREAVTACIMSIKDQPDYSMKALRILSREESGCEELAVNKALSFKLILGVFLASAEILRLYRK